VQARRSHRAFDEVVLQTIDHERWLNVRLIRLIRLAMSRNIQRWARFAAIDHRSTDPREFQIAPFTLGFIVAHKSRSFLRADKTGRRPQRGAARREGAGQELSAAAAAIAPTISYPEGILLAARRRGSLSAKIVLVLASRSRLLASRSRGPRDSA